jgi:spermidine/putrescine transport system substrate-binding protein
MTDRDREIERLLASAPRRTVTRREVLRRIGAGAGVVSLSAWLAACGVSGTNEESRGGGGGGADDGLTTTEQTGEFRFANWPLYIDRAKGRRPTIDDFEKETGITVDYKEVIDDNESFFGTIREPLASGQSTGWT